MADSRIKDGNYYLVQSFMVKELGLKGLEKEVYAIIYGFSQAENQKFDGSLQYLADWTLSTKQGIMKVLKSLQDKGLINKEEEYKNGVKFVKYYTTEFNGGIKHSLTEGIKHSLTNNIDNNNISNNIYSEVLDYLNQKAGTHYRQVESNYKHIKARLQDFSVEDLKSVINKKCKEWIGTDFEKYLTPETLFRPSNFEKYLNQNIKPKDNGKQATKREYTKEELNNLFDNIEDINI
jgi:uncharacterized phage protein (TIGR02220 family)